jgi:YggT family protein
VTGLFEFEVDSVGGALAMVLQLLALAILVRALLSWFIRDPYNPVVQALDYVTEPILQPLRSLMPRMGMIDFTPMVAIIVLSIVAAVLRDSGI